MALSATATVSGSTATVTVFCDAGADVRVQAGVAFVGTGDSGLARAGDLIVRAGRVTSDTLVRAGDTVLTESAWGYGSGLITPNGSRNVGWCVHDGSAPLYPGDLVWRGASGAPILGKAAIFTGGSATNISYPMPDPSIDPGPTNPGLSLQGYAPVDKSLTTDAAGSLVALLCVGFADSWNPPTNFLWATPVALGGGLGPLAQMFQIQTGDPNAPGLTTVESAALWTHRKTAAGATGNWDARIRWSNPWDDGHSNFDLRTFAIRPAPGVGYGTVGAVTSPTATTRQATITDLAPETVITVSDGTDVVTARITLTVNEPMNLGDGRWKLSGTRA